MTKQQSSVGAAPSAEVPVQHMARLTVSEIAQLWATYMEYSMLTCVFSYFERVAQDSQVRDLITEALKISETRVSFARDTFQKENIPLPMGFTASDVNLFAPALFSDTYLLNYLRNMIRVGMTLNSLNVNMSSRPDIRDFFAAILKSTISLNTKVTNLMLSRGVLPRPPWATLSQSVEYVQETDFLTGFFGEKRPLITIEIAHLYHNVLSNEVGRILMLGFRQVSLNKQVRDYFSQGIQLCDSIIQTLSKLARKEHVIFSSSSDMDVTDATEAPFSDKLMMFHIFLLNTIGAGMYGVSGAVSGRHDIMQVYGQYLIEVGRFAEKGAKLMMKNDWLEEPPQILDREELAELKH